MHSKDSIRIGCPPREVQPTGTEPAAPQLSKYERRPPMYLDSDHERHEQNPQWNTSADVTEVIV